MGNVFSGIDQNLALSFQRTYSLKYFIETGTLVGKTTKWASNHFEQVITIEYSEKFYKIALDSLESLKNVAILHGKSEVLLEKALKMSDKAALIWLDAHWSRDLGYEKPDVICPVLDEISAIERDNRDHVIMVDDARLFGIERGWPSLQTVKEFLGYADRTVFILNDIIVSMP